MQSVLRDQQHSNSSMEGDEVASPAPEEHLSPSRVPGQSILTDTEEGTLQPLPPPHCPSAEDLDKLQTKQTLAKKYRVSFLPYEVQRRADQSLSSGDERNLIFESTLSTNC